MYAAQIENGIVIEVIVGTAAWAIEHLGGEWIDSPTKIGTGWTWTEQDGFRAPQPSPDCVWDAEIGDWDCPSSDPF